MKPQFQGIRAAAANISEGRGSYTAEMFREDFPQFFEPPVETEPPICHVPPVMLEEFLRPP